MSLHRWIPEIARAVSATANAGVLDIRQPASASLSRAVAASGFPGVLPLWSGRLQTVGLLADPSATPETWSAVILKDGQGLTLSTDGRTLLPQFIIQRVLSNLPEAAERFAERWDTIASVTTALHRVLGGTERALEDVVAVVRDPVGRGSFKYEKHAEAAFQSAHSRLERAVDRSEAFIRYADWLDACLAGQCAPPDEPATYGSWGRRVNCWANRLLPRQHSTRKMPASRLREVIEGHAGIDSGVPVKASWSARPGAASGEAALAEAARQLEHEPPAGDNVADGVVQALLTEGAKYRGYAHAEAVVALDERGEAKRAWATLQSAAWWAARNAGHVPEAMIAGARSLADRHRWADLSWMLEQAAKGTEFEMGAEDPRGNRR